MKSTSNKSVTPNLRQKAEKLLKKKTLQTGSQLSKTEMLKLIHDLEVNQKELVMQNEELKLAKEQAEVAAEIYAELFENAPSGCYILNKDAKISKLNRSGVIILGKERSLLENSRFSSFVSDDTKQIFNQFLEKVFKSRTKETCEVTLMTDNKLPRYVNLTGCVTENGKQCHINLVDNTERKQIERALRESEERFRKLVETSPEAITLTDLDGNIVMCNHQTAALHGFESTEVMLGMNAFKLFPPEEWQRAGEDMQRTLAEGLIKGIEYTMLRSDGSYFSAELSAAVILNTKGSPQFFMAITNNITERKQTEESLQNERRLFRTVIDLIPDAIYVKNAEGQKILANPKEIQLSGMNSENEAIGKTDFSLYPDQDAKRSQQEDQFVLHSGNPIWDIECTLIDKFGKTHSLLGSKVPLHDIHGKIIGIVGVNHDITELKNAVNALHESEERYRTIIENMGEGVGFMDYEERFVFVNRAAEEIFGVESGELMGKNLDQFLNDEQYKLVKKETELRVQGNKSVYELEIQRPSGEKRTIIVTAVPQNDKEKGLVGTYGVFRDITERKRAEEILKDTLRFQQVLLDAIPSPIFYKDTECIYIGGNKAFERYLGLTQEQFIGKTVYDISPMDLAEKYNKADRELMNNLGVQTYENSVVYADGTRHEVIFNKAAFTNADGKVAGIIGVILDISERKRVEAELAIEKQRLSDIIKGTNVGTWEWNIQTGETIFNEQWAEFIGYTLEEISPVSINTWIKYAHPEDLKVSDELLEKHFKGELDYYECEARMKHKNGNWIWILDRGRVHKRDNEGKPLLMSGTHQNITDRKETEQRIQSSIIEAEERERMRLSQELHDGLSPLLSAIKMYVQWLGMPNAKLGHTEIIKDIEKFLDESTRTVHEISFKLSPHILQNFGLIEAVYAFTDKVKESSNICVELNIENFVRFNKNAETIAYRVLCECINNTIKHASASKIVIDMCCHNDVLLVEYSDNGNGFDVDEVMSQHKGMGLLNMKSRIKSINGLIDIISTLGKGTIIKFQMKIKNN